jgi:hypothetical protein
MTTCALVSELKYTLLGVTGIDHVAPPSNECSTMYSVIAVPPFDAGAHHSTMRVPFPAPIHAGASGVVAVVALAVSDAVPVPVALTAETRNV